MHIVVCVKQVPDTTQVRIDPETNTLIREGIPTIINPYDLHAVEAAVGLKDKHGGHITIVTMGPPQAKEALREAISLGGDDAVLLTDRSFAGSDTLATSYILSESIKRLGQERKVDLVICGKQSIDGDTAQVGPGIAQRLNYSQLTYVIKVRKIDLDQAKIEVERQLENGRQVLRAMLPALLTVVKEINEIHYASLANLIKAAKFEPRVWSQEDLQLEPSKIGLKGSPTMVKKIFAPPPRPGGQIINQNNESAKETATKIVNIMRKKEII